MNNAKKLINLSKTEIRIQIAAIAHPPKTNKISLLAVKIE